MEALDSLNLLRGASVLVIGDVMLDIYLTGPVERISPEAPVQVVDVRSEKQDLGGAANVARNLAALRVNTVLASVVGTDSYANDVQGLVLETGINPLLIHDAERVTTRKVRVMSQSGAQQLLRMDWEVRRSLNETSEEQLMRVVDKALHDVDAVVVSDYGKGVLTPRVLQHVMNAARRANRPVVVDPKGNDYERYRGSTILTPNVREAELATGIKITSEESLFAAGLKLLKQTQALAVLITRGADGMSLIQEGSEPFHISSVAREVYDVTGAGDTVVALLAAGLAVGMPLYEAARVSNMGAGVVVGKRGTSTVSLEELKTALVPSEGKRVDCQNIERLVGSLKQSGKRIVFTNGCFDLLHGGHVTYLQAARQLGDVLFVGLNSDQSVRKLKGPQRPILSENERALMLAALSCVDYVVIFEEDTPLRLIEAVMPDILVKGGDYELSNVVGREVVESRGGRVVLVDLVEGVSTTRRVQDILSRFAK